MNILNWFKRKKKLCLDFEGTFNLTGLPIVTFWQGNEKLNFLLDTGCNISIINKPVLMNIKAQLVDGSGSVFGMEGNIIETRLCKINLSYKNRDYSEIFQAVDMDKTFSNIKRESGATVHGILGTGFFKKNKSILDFEELKAYFK